jgi:signal transduction histidine kinase
LDGILNELLIIGKITHGELDFKRIDVAGILKDVLEGVVTINSGVTVKLNIDKSIKFILSEKGLFQSILFNLISNAFKYRNTFKVPYLKINVTKKDKGILITIEDNGVGIREEDQTNLFKMFYRANTSYDGTGLGLYIVKTSLNKLGGEVSLKSTAGVGSTFYVYLPCEIV